ncbi:FAD-dependent oxidoreductase [filamentous cyanobacterium CCP1]|nr:FAD-dependent oxidoreductase [filamentous cyanobacterium CCP2]PSB61897.1 FAD-dependent oxidoreductase [filamentous cyanobacterium CCP1]
MNKPPTAERFYDFICFGDEVPGILTVVAAAREYRRRFGYAPRSLVMFKSPSALGVGGHLVRGRLAYLDRSSVPLSVRQALKLDTFGDPPALYKEFLQRAGVAQIALDHVRANQVLRQMLSEVGADILSSVEIAAVLKEGQRIAGIRTIRGEIYWGRQFFDSTVNAELAQAAGVQKAKGFETFGLPNSELSVTLVVETEGLPIHELKAIEAHYIQRLNNPSDLEAQRFINAAAWSDPALAQELRRDISRRDERGQFMTMWQGKDYIDVRCRALSIAYHAFRGTKLSQYESRAVFDNANIAILPNGNLSWNALLFQVNADEAEALARNQAKPTPAMWDELGYVEKWFLSLGFKSIGPARELYVRHAGNVKGAVQPLTGAMMLSGGVPATEALGTFGYGFDARGGIQGLREVAAENGFNSISFRSPLMNIGIRHALIKDVPNLAVISPASGFEGYACSAGRIVEYNVGVGQGVGIAAVLAMATGKNLADITNAEVRQVLAATGRLPKIYGQAYLADAQALAEFEQRIGSGIMIA